MKMVKIENKAMSETVLSKAEPSKYGSTYNNVAANIKVVVRVRPPNEKEFALNSRMVVDVVDENMLVFDPKEIERPFFYHGVQQPNRSFLKRANKELKFMFDHVCGQEASNRDVFEMAIRDMIMSVMEGYNCSVFVYGATGAGKTFTMIGSTENPGITYLTMENLFYTIESFEKDREFDIAVSYIEVYNENVYDLLKPSKTPLQLREDSKYGVMVAGLTLNNIKTARELLNMLENGNKNRTQHPTDANAESSRSHAVFQVYLKMRFKTSNQSRLVKLSMIDLAGSERASATGCVGERFKEGANINRSLLSLGNCINKLADGSKYIPYRDSKLTRLLKDSLGGNCKTVMIANISPSSLAYEDTYNTLKYAARANKIQLSVKKNIVDGETRISQYVKMIDELKKKVRELEAKQTLSHYSGPAPGSFKTPHLEKEKEVLEWRQRILEAVRVHGKLEKQLLALMSRQRVLALRHRLRTQAFARVAELAHRSSTDAIEQMCTEDIPRQERAAESYMKQAKILDKKILSYWMKWKNSKNELLVLFNKALSECPSLDDLIDKVQLQSKLRQVEARDDLRQKLLHLVNDEINAFTDYMSDMPRMLRNLYLILKGYDKVPPSLTTEYMEIMRKAKAGKAISWVDEDKDSTTSDVQFKYISTLDLENLVTIPENNMIMTNIKGEPDISCDSFGTDEITDEENKEPEQLSAKKRKGTPIKKASETIIIEDSFVDSSMDSTRTISSAKKVKTEFVNNIAADVENFTNGFIDPANLNSTFVLANKMEEKLCTKTEFMKRGLIDKTNTMPRNITFNDRAKVVKPVVGKALPFRRPAVVAPLRPAFGSSASRDSQRTVQVRARDRAATQAHPYARATPSARR